MNITFDGATFNNCTCNYSDGETYSPDKPIIITANSGYQFVGKFIFSYKSEYYSTEIVTFINDVDKLYYEGDLSTSLSINLYDNYTATLKEVETKPKVIYDGATFDNCTCNYSDGETYSPDKPIIITANSGYQFVGEFIFSYKSENYSTEIVTFINDGDKLYYEGDLSTSLSINLYDNYTATLKAVDPVEPVSAFTNLYLTNKDELALLSKERYHTLGNSKVDFGDYIINLYDTPFKVPLNIVGGASDIVLGNFKTSVSSTLLNSSKFIIDMGTINVTEKYNNVYDYTNVMYILHLPYFDKIYLDSEYVVNQSIKIEYVFDIYTGSATVNVYSSFIDSIIESRTNIIVRQIPFLQKQTNAVIGNITTVNKNTIVSPFIEVVRNIPYNVNTIFGGETIEYGVIGDYEGFTRCENVLLNSRATNTEKEEIIKLLNEGVML